MLAIAAGDHAATRFATVGQFAEATVALTHRALAHGAQVLVIPAAQQVATVQRLVTDAAPAIWRATGEGQVQFAEPATLRVPDAPRFYAQRAKAAIAGGYRGLWVSVDMSWAATADPQALLAFEAGAYPMFGDGRFTALCQYPSASYADGFIVQACQAHPANGAGVRVRHEFTEQGRKLRLWGETDLTNSTAFAVLVGAVPDDGTIDVSGMWFVDVRGLALLARRTPATTLVCTPDQARNLRAVGAVLG